MEELRGKKGSLYMLSELVYFLYPFTKVSSVPWFTSGSEGTFMAALAVLLV